MIAEDDKFVLKNYIDVYDVRNADNDPVAGKGAVHTVLTMQPGNRSLCPSPCLVYFYLLYLRF
jgi:hypothetical protein